MKYLVLMHFLLIGHVKALVPF